MLSSALMMATYCCIVEIPIGINSKENEESHPSSEDDSESQSDNSDSDDKINVSDEDKKECGRRRSEGVEEGEEVEEKKIIQQSSIPLRIQINPVSSSFTDNYSWSGSHRMGLLGIRGIGVLPLAQLYTIYCQEYCQNRELLYQSMALIESCLRHRQYQYVSTQETRSES